MDTPTYPVTHKVEQVDDYHGVKVLDPYRWLEDDTSVERAEWIIAQSAVTSEYLSQITFRSKLRHRLEQLVSYPRYYPVARRGQHFLFKRNEGLQNQLVLCVQQGLGGSPEVLVDPNVLSPDGTLRLTSTTFSKDGRYLAYGLAQSGGDWEDYFVLDMATKTLLPDRLRWVKCSMIAWHGDGFYYSRYPAPSDPGKALSARNENHQVWYHRAGTPQSADTLVYEDASHPLRFHWVMTTEDEQFVILCIADFGSGHDGYAIHALNAGKDEQSFVPVISSFDARFRIIDNEGDKLLFLTNHRAPSWRLVLIDPAKPDEASWTEVIAEKAEPLETVCTAGGKLFAIYQWDAAHRVYVLNRAGAVENELKLPGIGLVGGFSGQREDKDVLWTFGSFTVPNTVYLYNIATQTTSLFRSWNVQFKPEEYETAQVFYPSKDKTRIPMFIVHRKGMQLDGKNPALIYGYGGFGISLGPCFDPLLIGLLELGVVYAAPSLRGGGEYGETWHHMGWREKKQNVFDDFIAAAEWLQANGYTSRDRCALQGGSNGGLLVAAVTMQRPDLCKVALPEVGVMDMLRFQRFTIGWNWITEYGSSEDPSMFPILLAYSPVHNIRDGTVYPATLATTADHDDRIVPAHSFKFIATLQAKGRGPNPYLIRIETRSSHAAVSLAKELDERADLYAFMLANMPETGQIVPV
jgi:prolyl oligopeptidase